MNYPLISICIPVYGVEQFIERCARSLFEQSYENIEYIFVDDCTPDRSFEILNKVIIDYPQRKNQIHIIHHEKNRGLAASRNTAVDAAKGVFLMHVDSDDWLYIHAVEVLVKEQQITDADIVTGAAIEHEGDKSRVLQEVIFNSKEELICKMFKPKQYNSIWRRLIRRSLYTKNAIRTIEGKDNGEDYYTTPRLVYLADKLSWIDTPVYYYNKNNTNSYTSTDNVIRFEDAKRFWEMTSNALSVLRKFFNNKDSVYIEHIDLQLHKSLALYATAIFNNSNIKEYNKIVESIYALGTRRMKEIHWGTAFTRPIYRYYQTRYVYNMIKRAFV